VHPYTDTIYSTHWGLHATDRASYLGLSADCGLSHQPLCPQSSGQEKVKERGWWRQEMQLRIDLPGGCWLCIVLCTLSVVHADIGLNQSKASDHIFL